MAIWRMNCAGRSKSPNRYMLRIEWATLEDHTVGFRGSPAFTQWRAQVGPFFASAR